MFGKRIGDLSKGVFFAAKVLSKVEKTRSSIRNILYKEYFKRRVEDYKLLNQALHFALETTRRLNFVDHIIKTVLPKVFDEDFSSVIKNLLRIATYQIVFLEEKPEDVADIIKPLILKKIQKSDKIRKEEIFTYLFKVESFVKKEKMIPKADDIERLAFTTFHPQWMCEYFIDLLGLEDAEKLLRNNNLPKPSWVRVNTLLTNRENVAFFLREEEILVKFDEAFPDVLRIINEEKKPITLTNPYKEGLVFIQDKASCAVAHILDAKPKDFVIDLCAAPGMKTTHIAQTMKNKGLLLATDINCYRAKMIKTNMKRSGIKNVEILCTDGKILKLQPGKKADKILVDAPCSGSGTFQTHPEEKWRLTPNKIKKYTLLQKSLLSSAVDLVKVGGEIVFSTCSLFPEEGEEIVTKICNKYPVEVVEKEVGGGKAVKNGWRFYPPETKGFFISKMRKYAEQKS
ncbi:MAG: transcription antitermination factor NusB [Candidatus Hodarchaeota archaeon]